MDLVNQPNKSNANLKQLENLSSKITKNYQELGDELKQIDFTQFDIEIDPKVLDALNVPYFKPENPETAVDLINTAWITAENEGTAVGILLEIPFWK